MMTEVFALECTARLAGVALALQAVEMLQLRGRLRPDAPFGWKRVRSDFAGFPSPIRAGFDLVFQENIFSGLLGLQLTLAVMLIGFPHPVPAGLLFTLALLGSFRWRGAFNGAADAMTLVVLGPLTLGLLRPEHPWLPRACLWYVAVQSVLSYLVAGIAKARHREWWSGRTLVAFLSLPDYGAPAVLARGVRDRPAVARALATMTGAFEVLFPLALIGPASALAFMVAGVMFHLANAAALGLNRFFWIWLATYPAIWYCARS